jgi:hypothetical protein
MFCYTAKNCGSYEACDLAKQILVSTFTSVIELIGF